MSTTREDFDRGELIGLLELSRSNNHLRGLSGIMLYKDKSVIQVLEGDKAAVTFLFQKIKADRRHHGVKVLLEKQIEARDFNGWSMGFVDLDSAELRGLTGYSEFMNTPLGKLTGSQTLELLGKFKAVGGWLPALTLVLN